MPVGVKNRIPAELKGEVEDILTNSGIPVIRSYLKGKKASKRGRAQIALKLLDYFLPKQRAVSGAIDVNNLSDDRLERIWETTLKAMKPGDQKSV